jgi:hypothetical protein
MDGQNKAIVICIPTYNRSEIINELFETQAELLYNLGYFIHIFDSSENRDTALVVEQWRQWFNNIRYTYIDSSVHSNAKVYQIFQLQGKTQEFNYVWLHSDYLRWSDRVLRDVIEQLKFGYDIIVPNHNDREYIGNNIYNDYNTFFQDCGWQLTLYGTSIIKTQTMLHDVPWDILEYKYLIPDRINHSHVAFYFEKIVMLPDFHALHLSYPNNVLRESLLRKRSGWWEEAFYVWGHCWRSTIMALPACYVNKQKLIKKHGPYSKIFTYKKLLLMKKDQVFNIKTFWKYRKDWTTLTDVNPLRGWLLSILPLALFLPRKHIRLLWFTRKYHKVYIYGAGRVAEYVVDLLSYLKVDFRGFIVTNVTENPSILKGHPVNELSDGIIQDKSAGILIGLGVMNTAQILPDLITKGLKKRIYVISRNKKSK